MKLECPKCRSFGPFMWRNTTGQTIGICQDDLVDPTWESPVVPQNCDPMTCDTCNHQGTVLEFRQAAAPYGFCPTCGTPGKTRERRLGGNDRCSEGHVYPSAKAELLRSWQMNEYQAGHLLSFLRQRSRSPAHNGDWFCELAELAFHVIEGREPTLNNFGERVPTNRAEFDRWWKGS